MCQYQAEKQTKTMKWSDGRMPASLHNFWFVSGIFLGPFTVPIAPLSYVIVGIEFSLFCTNNTGEFGPRQEL